jgi:hypothetical protein
MHAEVGYLRPKAASVDAVVAQATGVAEVSTGAFDAASRTLSLRSTSIGGAEKVEEVARQYVLSADGLELEILVSMRTRTQPLLPHLRAKLRKV